MKTATTEAQTIQERQHQQSETEYQIRINGSAVRYFPFFNNEVLEHYAQVCADNQGDYVDIVSVRKEILLNQGSYHQMKRHFCPA